MVILCLSGLGQKIMLQDHSGRHGMQGGARPVYGPVSCPHPVSYPTPPLLPPCSNSKQRTGGHPPMLHMCQVSRQQTPGDLVGKVGAHAMRTTQVPQLFVIGCFMPKATDRRRGHLLVEVEGTYASADINRRDCVGVSLVVLAFVRLGQQQHQHISTQLQGAERARARGRKEQQVGARGRPSPTKEKEQKQKKKKEKLKTGSQPMGQDRGEKSKACCPLLLASSPCSSSPASSPCPSFR